MPTPKEEARERLEGLLGLPRSDARRAVEEMLDCFRYEVGEYISMRHRELKARGTQNDVIYKLIQSELAEQRFAAPALSERQIRRRIYG